MNVPSTSALTPQFPRDITRETMAVHPIRRYEGEVVLVENHRVLVL